MWLFLIGVLLGVAVTAWMCWAVWRRRCSDCGYPLREEARGRHRLSREEALVK